MAGKSKIHWLRKWIARLLFKNAGSNRLVWFVIIFAVVGSIILIASQAASPNTNLEPEDGSVKSPAQVIDDGSASGGKALQFNNANTLNGSRLGISTGAPYLADGLTANAYMARIATLGVKWVRLDAILNQPITYADNSLQAAKNNGLKVLATFAYGNTATEADRTKLVEKVGDYLLHWHDEDLLSPISAFEMWNEPNNKGDSSIGYVNPANMADFMKRSYPIIKYFAPGKPVVAGGYAPGGGNTECCTGDTWNPADYLDALYKANGNNSNGLFDAAAIHPYDSSQYSTNYPNYGWRNTHWLRKVMNSYGDSNKQIWATEAGWPSCASHGSNDPYTEEQRVARFKADMKDWFYGIHNSDGSTKKDGDGNYVYSASGSDWNTGPFMIFKLYKTALSSSANSLGLIYTPTMKCDSKPNWYEPPIVNNITLFSATKQSQVQPSW